MYRVAWRIVGNSADAEDAVQEVFVGIARSPSALAKAKDLAAYVFATLRNCALRLKQSRNRRREFEIGQPRAAVTGADREHQERLSQLRAAMDLLPPEQREVVSLKIDGQLTFQQIAEVCEIRANTAASRYRYALQKLGQILGNKT